MSIMAPLRVPSTQYRCQYDATLGREAIPVCKLVPPVVSERYSGRGLVALFKRTLLILIFSLSTLHREYAALMAMPHYDCADLILKPHLPKQRSVDQKEVQHTMTKYNVNEPQA